MKSFLSRIQYVLSVFLIIASLSILIFTFKNNEHESKWNSRSDTSYIVKPRKLQGRFLSNDYYDLFHNDQSKDGITAVVVLTDEPCSPCLDEISDYHAVLMDNKIRMVTVLISSDAKKAKRFAEIAGLRDPTIIIQNINIIMEEEVADQLDNETKYIIFIKNKKLSYVVLPNSIVTPIEYKRSLVSYLLS